MTYPNPSTALATVIVDELARTGVSRMTLTSGSRSAPLVIAADKHSDFDITIHIDERSAAYYALGQSVGSQTPGLVLTTSGTAVANLVPALTEAKYNRVPLIALTADRPPSLQEVGANQTVDQLRLLSGIVNAQTTLGPPLSQEGESDYWRSEICRLVSHAWGRSGPPGPVQINVRLSEPLLPLDDDGRSHSEPYRFSTTGRKDRNPWTENLPSDIALAEIPKRWVYCERGLVIAGNLGGYVNTGAWADTLADRLGWPLLTEPGARSYPSQTISYAHFLTCEPEFVEAYQPEVVLVLGRAGLSPNVSQLLATTPQVIADPWGWPDPHRNAIDKLSGLPTVSRSVPDREGNWRRDWLEANQRVGIQLDRWLLSGDDDNHETPTQLPEPIVARIVATQLGESSPLFLGSSMPVRHWHWLVPPTNSPVFCNRGASGIDGLLSTAWGIATTQTRPMVAMIGDLSLLHDTNAGLVKTRPDLTLVVVNNDGGGIFELLPTAQLAEHTESLFVTPTGRDLSEWARWHGLAFHRANTAEQLRTLLEAVQVEGGTQVIEAYCDREGLAETHREAHRIAHAEIRAFLSER